MTGGKMTGGTGVGVGSRLGTVVKECTDGASKRGVLTLTVIVPSGVPIEGDEGRGISVGIV